MALVAVDWDAALELAAEELMKAAVRNVFVPLVAECDDSS